MGKQLEAGEKVGVIKKDFNGSNFVEKEHCYVDTNIYEFTERLLKEIKEEKHGEE